MFPPRNEPNDFYHPLKAVYRDRARVPRSTTYLDAEGTVMWLTEYARYRVGECGHAAHANTLSTDRRRWWYVCLRGDAGGSIPFPPRKEGLQFMKELERPYRDQ